MIALTADTIKTVGTSGDFQTVNQALEYFSGYYPVYKKGGINAEIKLLSGFVMAEQVIVSGIELSWIRITSYDVEVSVDASALTTSFHNFYPLFGVDNGGSLPKIDTIFNYLGTSTVNNKHGVLVIGAGSVANVTGGVKNAHGHGVFAEMCGMVSATHAKFSGAKANGALALCSAIMDVGTADLSGATAYGMYAIGSSLVNAGGANVSGAYIGVYASESSTINAAITVADNCSYAGFYVIRDSHVCAHDAFIRNQTVGNCCVAGYAGATIEARNVVTTGSTVPVFSTSILNTLSPEGIIFN